MLIFSKRCSTPLRGGNHPLSVDKDYICKQPNNVFISEEDTTPPRILNCPSSETTSKIADSSDSAIAVSWTEPTAVDESGNVKLLMNTHSPGQMFRIGSTMVMYLFTDSSNNIASCTFDVTVSLCKCIQVSLRFYCNLEEKYVSYSFLFVTNWLHGIVRIIFRLQGAFVDSSNSATKVSWTEPFAVDESGTCPVGIIWLLRKEFNRFYLCLIKFLKNQQKT